MPEPEFTAEQLDRIDAIHNTAHDLCRILADDEHLEWDMYRIGEIAEFAAQLLCEQGIRVRYPARITDEFGNTEIHEYFE